MSVEIILLVIYLGIALAMDAFAVSVTDGLVYQDINKKKALFERLRDPNISPSEYHEIMNEINNL